MKKYTIPEIINKIGAVFLIAIFVITFLQVIFRKVLGSPLNWSIETSILLLSWLSFLGAISLEKYNEHVSIDLVIKQFNTKTKLVIEIIGYILVITMFVALIFGSGQVLKTALTISDSSLPVSLFWNRFPIIITSIGCIIYMLLKIKFNIKKLKEN